VIEKIGSPGYETVSDPNVTVLRLIDESLGKGREPTFYEVGVGVGATTLPVVRRLANRGCAVLFSRERDVRELAEDLRGLGFDNVDDRWGSAGKTYSGYHFELARGFSAGELPQFDVAYLDGGHVFHLDAPATCVLKELCAPGGHIVFDDWYWTLGKSPTLKPSVHRKTADDYDPLQIETCHVQLVCRTVMDPDPRFEFLGLEGSTAVYRRLSAVQG